MFKKMTEDQIVDQFKINQETSPEKLSSKKITELNTKLLSTDSLKYEIIESLSNIAVEEKEKLLQEIRE